jgi:hypothetical protein
MPASKGVLSAVSCGLKNRIAHRITSCALKALGYSKELLTTHNLLEVRFQGGYRDFSRNYLPRLVACRFFDPLRTANRRTLSTAIC